MMEARWTEEAMLINEMRYRFDHSAEDLKAGMFKYSLGFYSLFYTLMKGDNEELGERLRHEMRCRLS